MAEVNESPEGVGFDRQAWFPWLVYHHLKSEYSVEYSLRHIRRLMREAGLTWRTARPEHYEGDPEQAAEFQETVKKGVELIEHGWTFIPVDQFSKPGSTVLRRAWHRIGSRPTVEVAPSTDRVTVLGAVTHDGRRFCTWTEENLTADHGIHLLAALKREFGEKLVVLFDRASYFYAKDVWEFMSDEKATEGIGGTLVERVRDETFEDGISHLGSPN